MIPIFKSCYSIGKSILTLDTESVENGSDSIIEICKENNLQNLVLVEDSMTGFIKAFNNCAQSGINLIFGLRITCCNSVKDSNTSSEHKVVIFAKNDNGCKLLNNIFSFASLQGGGRVDFEYLNSIWNNDLHLVIPFYDSFIFNNNTSLSNCIPDFSVIKPTFFIEDNNLPFDSFISKSVKSFAEGKYETELVKSIYYKDKKDFEALQTYKILCNRSFGKECFLSSPNLNHFGSDEFCFESYLEYERRTA